MQQVGRLGEFHERRQGEVVKKWKDALHRTIGPHWPSPKCARVTKKWFDLIKAQIKPQHRTTFFLPFLLLCPSRVCRRTARPDASTSVLALLHSSPAYILPWLRVRRPPRLRRNSTHRLPSRMHTPMAAHLVLQPCPSPPMPKPLSCRHVRPSAEARYLIHPARTQVTPHFSVSAAGAGWRGMPGSCHFPLPSRLLVDPSIAPFSCAYRRHTSRRPCLADSKSSSGYI